MGVQRGDRQFNFDWPADAMMAEAFLQDLVNRATVIEDGGRSIVSGIPVNGAAWYYRLGPDRRNPTEFTVGYVRPDGLTSELTQVSWGGTAKLLTVQNECLGMALAMLFDSHV